MKQPKSILAHIHMPPLYGVLELDSPRPYIYVPLVEDIIFYNQDVEIEPKDDHIKKMVFRLINQINEREFIYRFERIE